MKKFVAGLLVGVGLCIASTSIAASVKEFILTEADYPIYVNGNKYTDKAHPILTYEGSTYVPLAKLGDITGVNYTWNSQLKRVEIKTSTPAKQNKTYREFTKDVPNYSYVVGIPDGKRIEQSDGVSVLYKYDVTDALENNLVKYEKALKKAGYVYESETSTDEILYYSKGKTVVGLWLEGYDFYVLVTTD